MVRMAAGYRGLSSDLDVLQTVYTPFAGQPQHQDSEEEEDSENEEAPPQRFAGGGAAETIMMTAAGIPRRGNAVQASFADPDPGYCAFLPVFWIRSRIHRIHMFLGLPDPDPLVRGSVVEP